MKPKIRIQLLSESYVALSDRLVDQYTELLQGPQDKHMGPVKLEVTLTDRETIDKFKEYLDKLKGDLPLEIKVAKKGISTKGTNPYKEIYQNLKKKENIEDIISYLDECNFRFISGQLIAEMEDDKKLPEGFSFPVDHSYQYLTRVIKFAKDPANDKFDFTLLIGIKFMGKPSNKVLVYYNGKLKATIKSKWVKGTLNMKEKKIPMVFPEFMTIEERKKWRYIRRKVELEKEVGIKDLKFYNRYKLDIKNLNEGKGFNL